MWIYTIYYLLIQVLTLAKISNELAKSWQFILYCRRRQRRSYYGINIVPRLVMNGVAQNNPIGFTQAEFDESANDVLL